MIFHLFGPESCRSNDLFMLRFSDSAYTVAGYDYVKARHNDPFRDRKVQENRECIEWDYGEVKKYWPFIDSSKKLMLRRNAVRKMVIVSFILKNAHNCMNGGQRFSYFSISPPTLQSWAFQGKRKVREPTFENSVFHGEHWIISDDEVAMFN
eukprot:gene3603-7170_t